MTNKIESFRRHLRAELSVCGLLMAWTLATALRSIYTRPYEYSWFVGVFAALSFAVMTGYVVRGMRERRRGDEAAERRRKSG